jgi:prepilin-type N-terminal cleavage/methylation domain-containing protein
LNRKREGAEVNFDTFSTIKIDALINIVRRIRMKKQSKNGFTLIELLVVISIIALLLSILMPALSRVKHIAKRTVCAARIKDASTALLVYASDNGGKLPLGAMGKGSDISSYKRGLGWSQTDYMHEKSYEPLKDYLEDTRTMMCTNLKLRTLKDSEYTGEGPFIPSWVSAGWPAYLIGFNYLGGHFGEAWPDSTDPEVKKWRSPYKLTDSGNLPLFACKVGQSTTSNKTFIAHSSTGPLEGEVGDDPREIAANGSGNLGKFDGSVSTQSVRDMEKHHAANNFGSYGSPTVYAYW